MKGQGMIAMLGVLAALFVACRSGDALHELDRTFIRDMRVAIRCMRRRTTMMRTFSLILLAGVTMILLGCGLSNDGQEGQDERAPSVEKKTPMSTMAPPVESGTSTETAAPPIGVGDAYWGRDAGGGVEDTHRRHRPRTGGEWRAPTGVAPTEWAGEAIRNGGAAGGTEDAFRCNGADSLQRAPPLLRKGS